MARGAPLLWGLFLGIPCFILSGAFTLNVIEAPAGTAIPFLMLGGFATAMGFYVRSVAPSKADVHPIEEFTPSHLPAYIIAVVSGVFLLITLVLLLKTTLAYIYPGITFFLFLLTFLRALIFYWQTTLTTYYMTDDRIISEYRFLGLTRTEFQHEDITNVSRTQSMFDTLLGLGTVTVSVPSGTISMHQLERPSRAEKLLNKFR